MEGWISIYLGHNECGRTCCALFESSPVSPDQAADAAADQEKAKYNAVSTNHWFIQVSVETISPINQEGSAFLDGLDNRIAEISEVSGDPTFLHQRINIII